MAEMEEEQRDAKCNANNVTMDTFCHQSPVTSNTLGEIENVTNERQISSDMLTETKNGFTGFTLHSTISNYSYYNSEEDNAERYPNVNPKVSTQNNDRKKIKGTDTVTNNINCPRKLLINRLIPGIIPVEILSIDQTIAENADRSG